MISRLSITIIVDEKPGSNALLAEHGLSLWIEADGMRILFDTGQSDALLQNAHELGIDLAAADAIVLSHGHYDHTGGLSSVMELNPTALIYCHLGVIESKYTPGPDATVRSIGIPPKSSTTLLNSARVRWVSKPKQFGESSTATKSGGLLYAANNRTKQEGIYALTNHPAPLQEAVVSESRKSIGLTGPVPRLTDFEDTGGRFFLDPGMQRPDPIDDDMALWIETPQGAVVIAGCCHSGIVNTVNYIGQLRPGVKIRAIIGGLHLLHASAKRLDQTIAALGLLSLERIVACHCTGDAALHAMKASLGNLVTGGAAGMKITFNFKNEKK